VSERAAGAVCTAGAWKVRGVYVTDGALRTEGSDGEKERPTLGAATVRGASETVVCEAPREADRVSAPQPLVPPESREKPSFLATDRVETPAAQKNIQKNRVV
jgi:hypothetical protein